MQPDISTQFVIWRETLRAEEALTVELSGSDTPPFIGQMHSAVEIDTLGARYLSTARDTFEALLKLLAKRPALAVAFVAGAVARQDHESIHENSVYPYIERLLGKQRVLDQREREEVVLAFRRACVSLGLTVQRERRPNDRLWRVNELILQGGVRRSHISKLVEVFLRVERQIGLPDVQDTTDCVRFCRAAAERLENLPRLQMVLENDQTGWHAAVHAKFRAGIPIGKSLFERELPTVTNAHTSHTIADEARRPELVLRGVDLCLTAARGMPLVVETQDGGRILVRGGEDALLPVPWPTALVWCSSKGLGKALAQWLAGTDAVAIFNPENGRFLGSAEPGQSVLIRPGPIAVISRKQFDLAGCPADVVLGRVYFATTVLERVPLTASPYSGQLVRIVPREERYITLAAPIFQDLNGTQVFGSVSAVTLQIPGELGHCLNAELLVVHPALDQSGVRLPVQLDQDGLAHVDIGSALPQSGSFGRMQIAVTLPGAQRPIVSAAWWLWPGLRHFDGARFHGPVPSGFKLEECRGIHQDSEGLVVTATEGAPEALLKFDAAILHLLAPGIHASIDSEASGSDLWTPISPGATLTLGGNLASSLRVVCDQPDAVIEIGVHVEPKAFRIRRVRRIGFPSLLAALEGGDGEVRVRYRGPDDMPITVCKLVRTETPNRFKIESHADFLDVWADFARPLLRLRLECEDLLTGRTQTLEVSPGEASQGQLSVASNGNGLSCHFRLLFAGFPEGTWRAEPFCIFGGLTGFRPLRMELGGHCAFAFRTRDSRMGIGAGLHEDPGGAFRRSTIAVSLPTAEEVADTAVVVEKFYQAAGRELIRQDLSLAAISFATDLVQADSFQESPGFIPKRSPWHINWNSFSAEAIAYDGISSDDASLRGFYGLGLLGNDRMVKNFFRHRNVDIHFAAAFGNVVAASRVEGLDLTDFDFLKLSDQYSRSIDGIWVDDPPLLGRTFFQSAGEHAAASLTLALENAVNGQRIRRALAVARRSVKAMAELRREAEKLADNTNTFPLSVPYIIPDASVVEDNSLLEDLFPFVSALALAARLDARKPGYVSRFMDGLTALIKDSADSEMRPVGAAGICTRIGNQFFSSHLLFWELLLRSREP